ncbi:MAG TPA: hypothetical protein PLN31_03260 [Azoarcus taiwanensis]|nr:hypothetical protein [Azoarcus taiwanensis]
MTTHAFKPLQAFAHYSAHYHLKSFLISRGLREKELRQAGHDLLTCLRLCRQHGLARYVTLSWLQQMQIGRVNVYYKDKELEYFVPRAKRFGNIDRLVETVDQVAKAVFHPITEESFRALSQPAT